MKFLGKLLLTLLLLAVLVLVIVYVVAQTHWGANRITQWVNDNTDYQLTLGDIEHNWSEADHILFNDVTFASKGQPVTLVAQQVSLGLSARQLTDPRHFGSVTLQGGTLNLLSGDAPSLPVEADVLQLRTMALQSQDGDWSLNGQQVNGGITPWKPEPGHLLGKQGNFQLSARSLRLNEVPASQVLIQGEINNARLALTNFGADVAGGQLTGNATRDEDGSWRVDNLRLSNVRLQTDKTIEDFWQPVADVPSVAVARFDMVDARIEGPGWAFNDLDVTLQNITFKQHGWESEDGSLSFNATDIVNGGMHLIDPIVNLGLSPQGVAIKQFTTRWEGGLLRTDGTWSQDNRRLSLNELVVAGMEYTLPTDWRQRWQKTLPDWLAEVEVKKFRANRNLLIDINPDFPFQLTSLDAYGNNLLLARQHQWGVWQGSLNLNASDATFNKLDVRRPSLALNASDAQIAISELSAFTQQGLLEAQATLDQQPSRTFSLSLNGRSVPMDTLTHWGWQSPETLPATNSNIQLHLNGKLDASQPLKPTLNGQFQGVAGDGKSVKQQIQHGEITIAQ